jgi:hypothetical protein
MEKNLLHGGGVSFPASRGAVCGRPAGRGPPVTPRRRGTSSSTTCMPPSEGPEHQVSAALTRPHASPGRRRHRRDRQRGDPTAQKTDVPSVTQREGVDAPLEGPQRSNRPSDEAATPSRAACGRPAGRARR